jgi:predicted TIM-barrel fold metal-dependent hydrolase
LDVAEEPTGAARTEEFEAEPIEIEARRWLDALEAQTGPLALFDTHTHFGRHDPDEFRQEPEQLLATMKFAGARAITFPMHEPAGYPAANDEARAIEAGASGRVVHFCRVNPHDGALAEAERCLDLGAHGIKLHPRAEQFAMSEPAVEDLTRLAQARGVPILIHAGRGIPALGQNTLELAQRYPGAKFILAHAAVSDLAWLWRLMPENPNLFIDTSWWNPADFVALFSLVPPGQLLWASDNPYGYPLHAAAFQLRYALLVGLGGEAIQTIAGGQIERILAGEEPLDLGSAPGPPGAQDPGMERVVSHLTTAMGRAMAEGDPSESIALGYLAVDVDGPEAETGREILRLLDIAGEMGADPPPGRRFPRSAQFVMSALALARTPGIALPSAA